MDQYRGRHEWMEEMAESLAFLRRMVTGISTLFSTRMKPVRTDWLRKSRQPARERSDDWPESTWWRSVIEAERANGLPRATVGELATCRK
jgi:hypothetical protein